MNHFTVRTLVASLLLACAGGAMAHEYSPLLRAEKFGDAERAASAKLAQEPTNRDALIGKAQAIYASAPERIDEAVKLGEQCVAAHPNDSLCHLALGEALGTKAQTAGMMSAMSYAGKMRDALKRAVELDGKNLAARFSLLQFYVQAPGIAGGSSSKARDLAADSAKINPEAGKLMQAIIEMGNDAPAKAEALTLSVNAGGNELLLDQQRDFLANLGSSYLQEKKYADSERVFTTVQQRFPDSEWGAYGLGRVQQEQGKHQAALPLFEKAAALAPQPRARIYFRLGLSQQALGDKAKAITSFEKALATKPALSKKMKEDAMDKLKSLKS